MSIKDLFDKGYSSKFVKNKTQDDVREDLESPRYIDAYSEKRARFVPDVDFATASNFARFGLAEEYYDQAIKRIYQTYPYDGSQAEKIEWENSSTYLDLYLFENEYPRTNGYVAFAADGWGTLVQTFDDYGAPASASYEYISINGGPNADPNGDYKSDLTAGPDGTGVSKANIYKVSEARDSNLLIDGEKGNTIEFWMKKAAFATSNTGKEVVFDAHTPNSTSGSTSYGRFTIELTGTISTTPFMLTYMSGTSGISRTPLGVATITTSSVADDNWHHYAVSIKNNGTTDLTVKTYVDGVHIETLNTGSVVNYVSGTINANIAALVTAPSGSTGPSVGYGKLSASIDEFRFWKSERDAQQVGRYYRDQIGGGTNTDNIKYDDITNKVDLGVYFKFNEGITGDSTTDATILDYSGRISNGTFTGYDTYSRNTGSAIVLSNAATKEFKDPIIYSTHPDVSALSTRYQLSGSAHDHENAVSIYKSVPGWILEEDERESNHLKYLTQILASYFDDLYLQIEKLPRLKDINYPDDTSYEKPLPFADRLLSSRGYEPPELFAHASALAKYLERGERKLFEKKLYEVKNIIYQNIYNNLSYIQKSKGTYKSLRNFLRCFGVDQELVKLNIYANDDVYEFKDNYTNTSVQKRYLDFDDYSTRITASDGDAGAFGATAYQYYDSTDANSFSYIPRDTDVLLQSGSVPSRTYEVEVFFPKRDIKNDVNYDAFPSVTSSIFGIEHVANSNTDLSYSATNVAHFNVVAIKSDDDKRNVKFAVVTSSGGGNTTLDNELFTSNSYKGVYDNEKWNLAFRIAPTKGARDGNINPDPMHQPHYTEATGSLLLPYATAYTYELYGVNYISNILQNEFTISGTMNLDQAAIFFAQAHQRFFAGAKRTNFTGSIERYSDVKVSSCRVWNDYIPNEAIKAHARDASNYGVLHPYENINDNVEVGGARRQPAITSLLLHWDMSSVTGSNASGRFQIPDVTSGSTDAKLKFGDDWTAPYTNYNYTGRGDFFVTDSNYRDQAVDIEFVQTAKQKLPEVVNSDDMVKILNKQDDVVFTRDTTYVQHLLSVEKSMYQIISEEMLRIFATIVDFNNLVGEPVNRYRPHYKKMEKLRELYFERIENDSLDLEKFIEYFKWVDDAVSIMIAQLIPISSNAVELLRNMVESHILERNKYWTKFPTLETKPHNPISSLKGIEELKYNWKFGHAPVSPAENTNQDVSCLWWRQRAGRADVLPSGDSNVDSNKDTLLKIITTEVTGAGPTLKTSAGVKYTGTYYNNRSLARPTELVTNRSLSLKAGSNPDNNNIYEFYKGVTKFASDDDFIYLDVDNEIKQTVCNDQDVPPELDKKEFRIKALVMTAEEISGSTAAGGGALDKQYTDAKSSLLVPFNMYSSSVNTGYISQWSSQFGVDFTNMHDDKYGPHAEIPLQGPFTEKYVGGAEHRHVEINQGSDVATTRAEAWHLQSFVDNTSREFLVDALGANTPIDFSVPSTDISALNPTFGSETPDPNPTDLWRNGINADNSWSFVSGSTPSAGTGPIGFSAAIPAFAYCEVLPSKVGQTFSLVTPLLDFLELDSEDDLFMQFRYHMHGLHIGNLKVQASQDLNFETGVTDLLVDWGAFNSTVISGQQHTSPSDSWTLASTSDTIDSTLASLRGKRFYIRFLYTAGPGHLGDCAICSVQIMKNNASGDHKQNSFKLFSPTHDNVHRPSAIRMRDEYAKRPVNIRNIEMTGSSPTKAGNYLDRYEYVSVMSEQNDPWFVTNVDSLTRTTAETLVTSSAIASRLSGAVGVNYTLPDRTFISGTTRNRTRFVNRFSSPGGFEVMSRGFLDPAHETFSVYNAMTYRNLRVRQVFNSQLQAHQGRFGVSSHRQSPTTATATIEVADGDAASGMLEQEHITITSTDGTIRKYIITDANNDGGTNTGDVLSDADNTDTGVLTAGPDDDGGIAVSIATLGGGLATQNDFLVQLKAAIEHANGHNGKITVSAVPGEADGPQSITLTQTLADGAFSNRSITTNISQINPSGLNFTGGVDATARIYGSETAGTIQASDYTISGDASRHKYHRNNIERIKFTGDDPTSSNATFVTASVFDNAFVSHMIPRTDNQTRWITASLI